MTGPAAQAEAGVGALLRAYRERAGLSQEALAARAGLAPAAVSALERGVRRRPYPHTLAALARALRLSAAERAALAAAAAAGGRLGAGAAGAGPSNLPAPATPLIGREREAAALAALLAEPGVRLVTLTGVGGCGKTRLALEVAHRLARPGAPAPAPGRDGGLLPAPDGGPPPGAGPGAAGAGGPDGAPFPDGVWLVELAALADPAVVPHAVAAALGVREAPGAALPDRLAAALRPRALLLVLDNCEHLLEACAALAARLLAACPALRVLATSREPLQIAGERQHPVPPLAGPEVPGAGAPAAVEDLAGYPAVRLFVERARAVAPGFALTPENAAAVARVCARLDGLPLALELAAARAGVLSVGQIAARLDDSLRLLTGGSRAGPTRQQTLRGALDWSHALLPALERVAFGRLSVFAGGFDLEAAEAVAGEDEHGRSGGEPAPGADRPLPAVLRAPEVLDALTGLVHRSLVVAEPGGPGGGPGGGLSGAASGVRDGGAARYRLLEPVRQYAAGRLAEAGEAAAVRRRHAAFFLALTEAAAPALLGPEQPAWLGRLAGEHDNLRAALAWGLEDEPGLALRLAGLLWPFWRMRQHYAEGADWLARALAAAPEPGRTADWARAALGAGILACDRGDRAAARGHLEASLEASRALGETGLVAWALRDLGTLHIQQRELGLAEARAAEGLAIARIAGDRRGTAGALMIRAHAAALGGDAGRARALGVQSLAAAREAGDPWLLSTVLQRVGLTALEQGDLDAAGPVLEEGLARAHDLGLPARAALFQLLLGRVALARGEPERARPLLEACRAAASQAEGPDALWVPAAALGDLGRAALARGEPAEAARLLREALRLRQAQGERVGIAMCLEALAAVEARAGVAAGAARLLGAAAAARRALGAPPKPIARPEIAAAEGAARGALGAAAYAAARAAGAALSLEQAAAEALAAPPPPAAGGGGAAPPGRVSGRRPTGARAGASARDAAGALTPREREVIALLAAGCHTDRQLAERLTITPGTAGVHVQRILDKLGLHSRWEVAAWAHGDGQQAVPTT